MGAMDAGRMGSDPAKITLGTCYCYTLQITLGFLVFLLKLRLKLLLTDLL